ncbi:TrmH family RNA methyltransferase [Nitrosospira multiformis]|uniref:TrmH family RNA methyltransferase n=1 Tax=Nitrosospira multiformis TaxID=1231 RepID=A0A2T5IA26_9PROT|nr:RNA methyltransferase [Nitrosospira multiformis]PTQ80667.1 TrmH family RNA methyltransferase [Nitrosospira multiformis]
MKFITSRDNPTFKELVKLQESSRQRRIAGLTLLDGIHLIEAYFALGEPEKLVVSETGRENPEIRFLLEKVTKVTQVTKGGGPHREAKAIVLPDALFREVSTVKTETGLMAVVPIPSPEAIPVQKRGQAESFCALLEAIQDPGNVGSILRSAAAAGASDVYLSNGCADAWSPKTLRAAMGAHFLVRIHEGANLAEVARAFRGKVIASILGARKNLYQMRLTDPVAFVFGNEGAGLSDGLLQVAHEQITIPMPGGAESLNAAAAAAVCFFERVRQMEMERAGK